MFMRLATLALILSILPTPSWAVTYLCPNNSVAVPYPVMAEHLKKKYGETPSHLGVLVKNAVIQFSNIEKKTMSIVFMTPQGLTCLIAAAEDWSYNPQPVEPPNEEL